ncbi:MAG: DUF2029 domain-containing protein [Clostridiales bacterium]|nr:DUF2029 domain-containing protein [Clostridiales bacterium]
MENQEIEQMKDVQPELVQEQVSTPPFVDNVKTYAKKAFAFVKKWEIFFFLALISVFAVILRVKLFEYMSGDMWGALLPWFESIDRYGGIWGVGKLYAEGVPADILAKYPGSYNCDYAPTYLYFMAVLTYFTGKPIVLIKWLSVIFDLVLALFAGLIVRHFKKSDTAFALTFSAVLFLPTVFLNSAVWGQCDQMYVAFILMSLYCMLKEKPRACMVTFAIAFALKIQAVFFLPVLVLAVVKGKLPLWSVFFAALTYFITGLPAMMGGATFKQAYFTFVMQMDRFPALTLQAPNLYTWIGYLAPDNIHRNAIASGMLWGSIAITGIAMLPLYRAKFDIKDDGVWLMITAFFAAFMPFIMPHMHERYWFLSDIALLIILVLNHKKWLPCVALMGGSLYVVMMYLYQTNFLSVAQVSIFMLLGLFGLGQMLMEHVKKITVGEEDPSPLFDRVKQVEENGTEPQVETGTEEIVEETTAKQTAEVAENA